MKGLFLQEMSTKLNGRYEDVHLFDGNVEFVINDYLKDDDRSWQNDLYVIDLLADLAMNIYIDTGNPDFLMSKALKESIQKLAKGKLIKGAWDKPMYFGYRFNNSTTLARKRMKDKHMTRFILIMIGMGIEPIDILKDYFLDPVFKDFRDL